LKINDAIALADALAKGSPDQPRDDHGRFAGGGDPRSYARSSARDKANARANSKLPSSSSDPRSYARSSARDKANAEANSKLPKAAPAIDLQKDITMTAAALNLFIPITKVDAAQRLVYGLATAEVADRAGEMCDYATTKPYYEKWSGDIHKSSGGKSFGNLRAMHGKVAAGKVTTINFNDTAKQIEICSKVVDDNEWKKVEEGVYTGFSQGGAYVKRWKDENGIQKYTADPSEISLVDLPCLATATFEMIKADGATELRKFVTMEPAAPAETSNAEAVKAAELAKAAGVQEPTNNAIFALAQELAKNGKGPADFIAQARAELTKAAAAPEKPAGESAAVEVVALPVVEKTAPVAAAAPAALADGEEPWEQVWKSRRDGSTFKTKAELRKHHDGLDAAVVAAEAKLPIQKTIDELSAKLGIEKVAAAASDGDVADTKAKPGTTDLTAQAAATKTGQDAVAAGQVEGASDADKAAATKKKKPKKYGTAEELQKGLYGCAQLAMLISELNDLQQSAMWEANSEADGSTVADQLKSNVAAVSATLRAMVAEETAELFDPESENDALLLTVLENAAGMPKAHMNALVKIATEDAGFEKCRDAVIKAGARHSKADQTRIQDAHDNLVSAGADCGTDASKAATGDLAKSADELSKMTAGRDALQKVVDELQPQIDTIAKAVQHLLDQPVAHPLTRVLGKGEDNGGDAEVTADAVLAKMTPDQLSLMAIKLAQRGGQPLLNRGR
jgi:hypothetical protein